VADKDTEARVAPQHQGSALHPLLRDKQAGSNLLVGANQYRVGAREALLQGVVRGEGMGHEAAAHIGDNCASGGADGGGDGVDLPLHRRVIHLEQVLHATAHSPRQSESYGGVRDVAPSFNGVHRLPAQPGSPAQVLLRQVLGDSQLTESVVQQWICALAAHGSILQQ
jgi:hypothetical protein